MAADDGPLLSTGTARRRNSITALAKMSLRSPATMWAAPFDVHVLGVRAQLEERLRPLLAEDVGQPAPHEQRGQGEVAGARLQPGLALAEVALPGAEARVPVPLVPAVVAEADVLGQAVEVAGPRAGGAGSWRWRRPPRRASRSRRAAAP